MKQIIFLFCISIILGCSFIYSQDNLKADTGKTRVKFDPTRDPEKDLINSIAEAKQIKKRIILDVGGEWCIWCHRLDDFFEKNENLKSFLHENFVVMKVNFSPENKNEKFLSKFPKINGYPHIFVLERDGKYLHSQDTGELEKGKGYDHEKMFEFLKQWAIDNKEMLIKNNN